MISRLCFIVCLATCSLATAAQPYIDVVNARRLQTKLPFSNNADIVETAYNNLSTTIPLQLKNKDAIILSPYYENWNLSLLDSGSYNVRGWVMSLSFFKNIPNTKWAILPTFIIRSNKELYKTTSANLQVGVAIIASYKKQANLTYKFGVYYNKEFFGNFFIPLAGIDWRINETNNLFGVLPGNLIWEHKVSKSFHYGGIFRAITNSYRLANGRIGLQADKKNYLRIDDNQVAAFADVYLTSHVVLNAEIGHSVSRKFRAGYKENKSAVSRVIYDNDKLFLKASVAYRIRFK
jgi:hypothetical protein